MYFLEQIRQQFILTLSAQNGEGSAAIDQSHLQQDEAANDNRPPRPNLSVIDGGNGIELSESDQRLIEDIEQQLDGLNAEIEVVGNQQLRAFVNGLRRILSENPNEAEDEPEEMARLRGNIERLTRSLEAAQGDAGRLREILLQTVQSDITEIEGNIDEIQGEGETVRQLSESEKELLEAMEPEYIELISTVRNKIIPYVHSQQVQEPFKSLSEDFNTIDADFSELTDLEKFERLNFILPSLLSLNEAIDIAIRDNNIVGENGERLGEARLSLVEKKFQEIKESGTDIQKNIIGDKEFSEITPSDFGALAQDGINLSEFLLVNEDGGAFSGSFQEGQEFIMNSAGRDDLGGYLSGYVFDFQNVSMLTVGGREYTRDIESEASSGFIDSEGNTLNLRDGQKIIISSVQTIPEEDFTAAAERLRTSYNYDRGGDLTADLARQFEENSELNGFSFKDFLKALMSLDIVTVAEQLEHIMNGKFHQDPETQEWTQYDSATGEHLPVTEADMSIASLESFPGSYRANLVRTCRSNSIGVDEFVSQMNTECQNNGFPPNRFIALIGHESGWKSWAQNPTSSAYGLGQMIDSTWTTYANGGNRRNPVDQMKASIAYLKHIMNYRDCSPEDACAFYNTGEGFRVDNSPAPSSYINQNGVIVNKIPSSVQANGVTRREYFIGAVAYYNDISFSEASSRSKFGMRG